ncbi:hypothetical protein HK102_005926 [Quaeritorhiza haematococci]|nr:hypothetical protein HK102_005926 [Quaeritorhiza haematococci]
MQQNGYSARLSRSRTASGSTVSTSLSKQLEAQIQALQNSFSRMRSSQEKVRERLEARKRGGVEVRFENIGGGTVVEEDGVSSIVTASSVSRRSKGQRFDSGFSEAGYPASSSGTGRDRKTKSALKEFYFDLKEMSLDDLVRKYANDFMTNAGGGGEVKEEKMEEKGKVVWGERPPQQVVIDDREEMDGDDDDASSVVALVNGNEARTHTQTYTYYSDISVRIA